MSSQASSISTPIPSAAPKTRPRRQSRFTEGSPVTGPEVLTQDTSSNELFFTILQQMDEHERKRKHRDSNSSAESFTSHTSSTSRTPRSSAEKVNIPTTPSPREARRSVNFGRSSTELLRRSLDERPMRERAGKDSAVKGFKGRLRALTGGQRERNVKPYTGT